MWWEELNCSYLRSWVYLDYNEVYYNWYKRTHSPMLNYDLVLIETLINIRNLMQGSDYLVIQTYANFNKWIDIFHSIESIDIYIFVHDEQNLLMYHSIIHAQNYNNPCLIGLDNQRIGAICSQYPKFSQHQLATMSFNAASMKLL